MVITKMNNVLMKHSRILFGTITVVIIVSFVWFLTPGADGSLLFSGGNGEGRVVGKVFGEKVKLSDLRRHESRKAIFLGANYGVSPANFSEMVSRDAFSSYALLAAAGKLGLHASDTEVVNAIQKLRIFQGENGFDLNLYSEFVDKNLMPNGLSKHDFEEAFRDELTVGQLRECFMDLPATESEIKQMQTEMAETYRARKVDFSYADLSLDVKYPEEELMSFFHANRSLFMTQPRVNVQIAAFFNADYQQKLDPPWQEIEQYYKQHEAQFKKDGKVQPLSSVNAEVIAMYKREKAAHAAGKAAKAFREELYNMADTSEFVNHPGKAFHELALKEKVPLMSAQNIVPSTKSIPGIGTDRELISALFALRMKSPVSRSITGEKGSYVVLLEKREDAQPAEYESVKAEVESAKKATDTSKRVQEACSALSAAILESKNPGKELETIVSSLKGKVTPMKDFTVMTLASQEEQTAVMIPTGKISKPLFNVNGATMIFVDARVAPDAAALAQNKAYAVIAAQARKQTAMSMAIRQWIGTNAQSFMKESANESEKAENPQ